MTTLTEHIIVVGAENRLPILEKSMYDSWASRIRLFIKGKKHGRMMIDSIDNGPLVYPTVEENWQTRPMKCSELTEAQQLQDDCDVQATNIILHGLPPDVYALVNHHEAAKDIWDMVKLLMKGTELSYQEPEARKAGQILDEEQLAFLADPGISNAPVSHQTIPQNLAFQNEDLDAYDSDCDDLSSAKAVLMAYLSSCDPEVFFEVPYSDSYPNDMINQDVQEMHLKKHKLMIFKIMRYIVTVISFRILNISHLDKENQTNKLVNESLIAELERYKERVTIFEQRLNVDLNKREKLIDSQMDDLIQNRNAKLAAFQQEIDTLKETLSNHVKEKESLSKTLIVFKTKSKEKESKYIEKKIVLEKQNKELEKIICNMYRSTQAMHMLTKPQVLFDDTHKQALGYQNPFHLKKAHRIQPTLYDGSVIAKEHAVIFVIDDEETLILKEENEITEVQTVFNQMKAAVDQSYVDKNAFEIQIQQSQEKDRVIRKLKDRIKSLSRKDSVENVTKDIDELETINIELEHKKVFAITTLKNELRKLKGKNVTNTAISKSNATIASGMFQLDIEAISHRLNNNRDAHEVYIEKTIENTDTLCRFVKRARTQNPSEPLLESAYVFTNHVPELLVYVSQTCPNSPKPSEKLFVVTPMNKDKRVRFVERVTFSSNIPKQADSLKTQDSNKPFFTSTGVKPTTSASGSKPLGNTKNNMIT
uniref:Integrase, catalytic region, zinc finger, CCHC-type, peptidase aspartic, catalytic n=1 Tax=Tanacetum cinerariifolium TaxID=118510 RepID=A0A699H5C8_TANCI|nr:hypothetical protein [Tanacetum cinerariifolium]